MHANLVAKLSLDFHLVVDGEVLLGAAFRRGREANRSPFRRRRAPRRAYRFFRARHLVMGNRGRTETESLAIDRGTIISRALWPALVSRSARRKEVKDRSCQREGGPSV